MEIMPSLDLHRTDIVVGVDTHKDEHVAVALDGYGGQRGSYALPATAEGESLRAGLTSNRSAQR